MSEPADDHALILQVSADNSRMLRAFETGLAKLDRMMGDGERRAKKHATVMEEAFAAPNLGKSLEKVFNSTRFAVIEEGSAKLRLFGSALEPLGGFGLAAAAGVAAFGLSMEVTERAVDFAASIAKTSHELGVSTDFLQEFNFAAKQTEIDVGQADGAIKALAASLGQVQAGLARKQTLKAWQALFGEDPQATLEHFKNVGELLPVLAEKMAGVGNAAEQAAIAKRLGIEALLPMLQKGSDNFATLAKRAHELGVVMDASTIEKGEKAKEKLNELDQVMKARTLITFAQFADTLVKLKTFLLDVETVFLRLVAVLTNTQPDGDKLSHLVQQRASFLADAAAHGLRADPQHLDALDKQIAELKAKVDEDQKAGAAGPAGKPPKTLVDSSGGTKHDKTDEFDKSANEAYQSGLKALAAAQAALLVDVLARAKAEKDAIDADLAKKTNAKGSGSLDEEIKKIQGEKLDAHKAAQLELLKQAKLEEIATADLKKQKIDRDAEEAVRKQQLERSQTERDGQATLLDLQGRLTFSESERAQIALQLVDLAYQRVKAELEGVIASEQASAADKELARLKLKQLEAQRPLQQEDARRNGSEPQRQVGQIVGGIKQRSHLLEDTRAMYAEINRLRQADVISEREAAQARAEVNARYNAVRLQNAGEFFGNLASLSGSSNKTLAAIGKAAAIAQATIDGILAVQKALASAPPPWNYALAASVGVAAAVNVAKIAGLKDGGEVVGEGGPRDDKVLRWLSNGEHVVNAEAASKPGVRALLDQINAGRDLRALLPQAGPISLALPSGLGGGAGGDFHQHNSWHIQNPDPDLARLIERQPRALKRAVGDLIRNREITLGPK